MFGDFITKINSIRDRGGMSKELGKLLVNSFYGRLGMKSLGSKTIIFEKKNIELYLNDMLSYTQVNNIVIAEVKNSKLFKPRVSNVCMAAIITAKARIKLYRGFNSVINAGGRLLYSDTDSIVAAYSKDMTTARLGDIYYDESSIVYDAVFAKPKTYSICYKHGYETKIKGMTKNLISFNLFKKKFYSGENIEDNGRLQINKAGFNLYTSCIEKTSSLHDYDKRIFYDGMKKTRPVTRG